MIFPNSICGIEKAGLLFFLLLLANFSFCQINDSTKQILNFKGSVSATNNGFSLVPTFSLGKPALMTGFSFSGKGRLSFEPQFWYSLKNFKPWSFIFIWRYKAVRKEKFQFTLGTHLPAINFKSGTVIENGVEKDIVKARRFYPAVELIPVYQLKKDISLSLYFLFGTGIEPEVSSKNFFLSLRPDFNRIPLSKQFYLRLNPQFYYLRIDDTGGFYTAASLTLARQEFPFSVSTMINKAIKSDIATKDFDWNVSLNYAFGKNYVER